MKMFVTTLARTAAYKFQASILGHIFCLSGPASSAECRDGKCDSFSGQSLIEQSREYRA